MLRTALFALCLVLSPATVFAQPSAPGDVMFVAFNADGTDGFAIVTLVDIPDTTVIHFSDNEWNGSGFIDTNEGEATWTNDTGGSIDEGTVLIFSSMSSSPTASQGSVSGQIDLNASNEILFAYLGTATVPTTFLSAIANDDFTQNSNSLLNTGLIVGTSAVEIDDAVVSDEDVAVYDGVGHCDGLTKTQCQMQIADVSNNWSFQDGSGDQSGDMTFPDFPDDVPGDFTTVPVELMTFSIE